MIILQAEFIGDNSNGSIPFENSSRYNLELEVLGSAFSTDNDNNYHFIGPIAIKTNFGKFPDYTRKEFDYERIESFLEDWQVVKVNLFESELPKFDQRKVKSLLFENMRHHKLNQLI